MKNFLMLLFSILTLVVVLMITQTLLSSVFEVSETREVGNYYESDLGFVLEEKKLKNVISYKNNDMVIGECVWLSGGRDELNKIADKLGLFVTNNYEAGGVYIVEGVSNKLKYTLEGRQANVQIAVKGDEIIVGNPIIYGSY